MRRGRSAAATSFMLSSAYDRAWRIGRERSQEPRALTLRGVGLPPRTVPSVDRTTQDCAPPRRGAPKANWDQKHTPRDSQQFYPEAGIGIGEMSRLNRGNRTVASCFKSGVAAAATGAFQILRQFTKTSIAGSFPRYQSHSTDRDGLLRLNALQSPKPTSQAFSAWPALIRRRIPNGWTGLTTGLAPARASTGLDRTPVPSLAAESRQRPVADTR